MRTRSLFIVIVIAHLLVDWAMPSLPGAFRFDPNESEVGIRVQPVKSQAFKPAPPEDLVLTAFRFPKPEIKVPLLRTSVQTTGVLAPLPRRDPSADRSSRAIAEDH